MTCPTEKTYVPYRGSALPDNAEEVELFNSTTAFGPRAAPHYRVYWVDIDITTDANADNEVQLQKSNDGGETWVDVGSAVTIGNTGGQAEFFVSPFQDFRILYTNGATPQTTFAVDLVLDHTSRSSAP